VLAPLGRHCALKLRVMLEFEKHMEAMKEPQRLSSRAWRVPSMGTVQMGFKSPVSKPEIMKTSTKIPAEVKELRVIVPLKEMVRLYHWIAMARQRQTSGPDCTTVTSPNWKSKGKSKLVT
jgi:hypothetical protein